MQILGLENMHSGFTNSLAEKLNTWLNKINHPVAEDENMDETFQEYIIDFEINYVYVDAFDLLLSFVRR